MKRIGFTGTGRAPIKAAQRARLRLELSMRAGREDPAELHLGDCVHADAEAHELAAEMNRACMTLRSPAPFRLVGHPPTESGRRAFLTYHEERPPKPYGERDDDIWGETEEMLATPLLQGEEEQRSGTWMTVRHALKAGRPVLLIWPDGCTSDGRTWYLEHGRVKGVLRVLKGEPAPARQFSLSTIYSARRKGQKDA